MRDKCKIVNRYKGKKIEFEFEVDEEQIDRIYEGCKSFKKAGIKVTDKGYKYHGIIYFHLELDWSKVDKWGY